MQSLLGESVGAFPASQPREDTRGLLGEWKRHVPDALPHGVFFCRGIFMVRGSPLVGLKSGLVVGQSPGWPC